MPPFIVTLTTMMFFCGAAIWFTTAHTDSGSQPSATCRRAFACLGQGGVGGLPFSLLIVAVVLAIVAHLALSRTLFGRWLFAIGVNPRAAEVSGVPVRRVVFWAYVDLGACRRPSPPSSTPAGSRPARRCWASASCSTSSARR